MSPIKPHGPVQPDVPGLPVSPREKSGDTPFDNFLPGQPPPGTPIEETPPPAAGPDDPRILDPMKGILPHPIRWKDGKTPAAGSPGADVTGPVGPLPLPVDPQLVAAAIASPQSWMLLTPPSLESEASPTDGGSAQTVPGTDVANVGITGTNAVPPPGTSPVETTATGLIRRMKVDGLPVSADPISTGNQASVAVVPRQSAPVDGTVTASPRLTPVPAAPVAAPVVPLAAVADLPATPLAADSRGTNSDPAIPSSPSMNIAMTTLMAVPPAVSREVALPSPTSRDLSLSALPDSRLAGVDPTASLPTVVTDSRIAATGMPPVPVAAPASVELSAANAPVEISPASAGDRAKIAGSATTESKAARKSEDQKSQVDGNEPLTADAGLDGTPVAKDEPAVNAALTANQKDSEASPLPKRASNPASGVAGASRTGNARPTAGETLVNVAVSRPASVEATTTTVTPGPTADPTSARQAVPVETLLQHTLSLGESVRPNGTDRMEMRVRLDGGHEDVTVQMQVVNDRMQVTFQTNSPELRKALEHGWEQFSGNAAQSSTLSMSEPRFETSRVNAAPSNAQADTASFSSNQQNPRRQDPAATFGDEPAPSVAARRADLAAMPALAPAPGQSAARRWSGWA